MTAQEAYKIIGRSDKPIECRDFGEFYGFVFGEAGVTGTGYICVRKSTGDVFGFMPYEDFSLFDKAKPVHIEE